MRFLSIMSVAAAVVVFMASCTDSETQTAKNIITAIQEAANDLNRSGGAGCEIKLLAPSPYTVIYFYPYTSFDDEKLEDSAKRELKTIAFSLEKPLFAVVGHGKVLAYGGVKLSLEPSRPMPMMWPPLEPPLTMPMMWPPQDGAIRIGFRKKSDGQYILY